MTRSKFSTKALMLATGLGLSVAAFAGPAAAQSYTCPAGYVYDPAYGCTTAGADDFGYDYDYGYPTVLYGRQPDHRGFDHGIGHGMNGLGHMDRGVGVAHFGGGGFGHGIGVAHAGGFGHMGGGFGGFHGGGGFGGHR